MKNLSAVIDQELGLEHTAAFFVAEVPGQPPQLVEAKSDFWARYRFFKDHPEFTSKDVGQIKFRRAKAEEETELIRTMGQTSFVVTLAPTYAVLVSRVRNEEEALKVLSDHYGKTNFALAGKQLKVRKVKAGQEQSLKGIREKIEPATKTPLFAAKDSKGRVYKLEGVSDADDAKRIMDGRLRVLGLPEEFELFQLAHGERYIPVSLGEDMHHVGPQAFKVKLPEDRRERAETLRELEQLEGVGKVDLLEGDGDYATVEAAMGEDRLIAMLQDRDIDVLDVDPVEDTEAPLRLDPLDTSQDIPYKGDGNIVQGKKFSISVPPGTVLRTATIPVDGLAEGHVLVRAGSMVFSVTYKEMPEAFEWKEAAWRFWREMTKQSQDGDIFPKWNPPSRTPPTAEDAQAQHRPTPSKPKAPPIDRDYEVPEWIQILLDDPDVEFEKRQLDIVMTAVGTDADQASIETLLTSPTLGINISEAKIEAAKAKAGYKEDTEAPMMGNTIKVKGEGQLANGPAQISLSQGMVMEIVKPLAGGQILVKTDDTIPRFFSLPTNFPGFVKKDFLQKEALLPENLELGDEVVPYARWDANTDLGLIVTGLFPKKALRYSTDEFLAALPMTVIGKGTSDSLGPFAHIRDAHGDELIVEDVFRKVSSENPLAPVRNLEEWAKFVGAPKGWPDSGGMRNVLIHLREKFWLPTDTSKLLVEAVQEKYGSDWPTEDVFDDTDIKLSRHIDLEIAHA